MLEIKHPMSHLQYYTLNGRHHLFIFLNLHHFLHDVNLNKDNMVLSYIVQTNISPLCSYCGFRGLKC
jgi:hypothetical protein